MTCKPRRLSPLTNPTFPLLIQQDAPPSLQQRQQFSRVRRFYRTVLITGKFLFVRFGSSSNGPSWLNYVYVAATLEARQ